MTIENKFTDKLIEASTEKGSIVCLGLDPVIDFDRKVDEKTGKRVVEKRMPDSLVDANIKEHGKEEGIGKAIEEFYCQILDGIGAENVPVAVVKPNYAFYAQFGFPGLRALKSVIDCAHENKFMVILDYKRGDIGTTSKAYAIEGFEFWGADAVTVAPYMGEDSVGPFIELANKKGRGVYILTRTSNKGAKNLQELEVRQTKTPFYLEVARCVKEEWSKDASGTVGVVVGATNPQEYCAITAFLAGSTIPQLVPGFGAQGGSAEVIFDGAIQTYQRLGFDNDQILTRMKTKRANSSSDLNFAWNLIKGFDESTYLDATIQAIRNFNGEIGKPLVKYGLNLGGN